MLKSVVIALLFSSGFLHSVFAENLTYPVYFRGVDRRLGDKPVPQVLENLKSGAESHCAEKSRPCLEGDYFKIVGGVSDTPISLDNSELSYRAASAYFNLTTARNFWVKKIGEEKLKHIGYVTVRMDIVNHFTQNFHFVNKEKNPEKNDALSIPASDKDRSTKENEDGSPKYAPWNYEIWFRPSEPEKVKVLEGFDVTAHDQGMKMQIRTALLSESLSRYAQYSVSYKTWIDPRSSIKRLAIDLAIGEGIPQLLGFIGREIKQKMYFDAAVIPEITYHEYTHLVFADKLPIGSSTAVTEGIANYFAIEIMQYPYMLKKMGKHGKVPDSMSGTAWDHYSHKHEDYIHSWENYTIQVLYHLGEEFGQSMIEDAVVLSANRLAAFSHDGFTDADIRVRFLDAIHEALNILTPPAEQMNIVYRMNKVLSRLGL